MKLDGKKIAEELFNDLRHRVAQLQKKHITPHLVVILVGENPASMAYVLQKQKKGEAIGARVTVLRYDESVTTDILAKKIKELNTDPTVHAILTQRPLPGHIDIDKLELLTNSQKDIDGFHPDSPFTLPLPLSVVKILQEIFQLVTHQGVAEVGPPFERPQDAKRPRTSERGNDRQAPVSFRKWLENKNTVIIGKGPTGGGPVITYLETLGVTPTIIDSKTPHPQKLMQQADIIIAATGREHTVRPEMLKKGVILIGVGILRGADGKLHGDYDEKEIENIASYYTPTPGGVGPVNVAMLLENLLTATEKNTRETE